MNESQSQSAPAPAPALAPASASATATAPLTATATEPASAPPSAASRPSPQAPRWYWEDFPVGQVREFGAMVVTREAVLAFAREFDPQPFHTDDEAAAGSLFGRLAASGWHTCAMAMRMMCDAYLLDAASLGSPGLEQIRWRKPVFPGDTLRVRLTVLEARPMASRPGVGLVRSDWHVLNQDGDTVLTMEGWGMYRQRGGGAPSPAD